MASEGVWIDVDDGVVVVVAAVGIDDDGFAVVAAVVADAIVIEKNSATKHYAEAIGL